MKIDIDATKLFGNELVLNNIINFGTLGFYCSNPVTYTYDRYEDNKIYVYTWGKFFTVAGNMLIMDGGDTFYTYDPETEYVNVN